MSPLTISLFLLFFTASSCLWDENSISAQADSEETSSSLVLINKEGKTVHERFSVPSGFKREEQTAHSFGQYLRNLPLKDHTAQVKLFNGETKGNASAYVAVVDLAIGTKDLHQCADAVMRLRAEYLWKEKKYEQIQFHFTNGFRADYLEWMKGKRIQVNGNSVKWVAKKAPSNTYADFWEYLEIVFTYAGTLSLEKELQKVTVDDLKIGDVFIRGGSPGHAVIVVDVAIDKANGKKAFLLAQSYMPAQEIQLLRNPQNEDLSPWYVTDFGEELQTSEWVFQANQLKRFADEF